MEDAFGLNNLLVRHVGLCRKCFQFKENEDKDENSNKTKAG